MKKLMAFLLTLLLLAPLASAQEVTFQTEGECKEFNVTVTATNFEPGNYDVKVDVHDNGQRVGEIYDPVGGWQSTMYYVNGALQVEERNNETHGNTTVEVFAETRDNITMFARIRQNQRTWDSEERQITQDCPKPEPIPEDLFFLASLTALLLILIGVTVYKKT